MAGDLIGTLNAMPIRILAAGQTITLSVPIRWRILPALLASRRALRAMRSRLPALTSIPIAVRLRVGHLPLPAIRL